MTSAPATATKPPARRPAVVAIMTGPPGCCPRFRSRARSVPGTLPLDWSPVNGRVSGGRSKGGGEPTAPGQPPSCPSGTTSWLTRPRLVDAQDLDRGRGEQDLADGLHQSADILARTAVARPLELVQARQLDLELQRRAGHGSAAPCGHGLTWSRGPPGVWYCR